MTVKTGALEEMFFSICIFAEVMAMLALKSVEALQALNSIPRERAEWILWLDMDMVLENITFTLPLESYAGKDFILWGQPEWIMKGHNAKGGHQACLCSVTLPHQPLQDPC